MTDQMADYADLKYPQLKKATLRRKGYARLSTLNQMQNVNDENEIRERNKIIKF